MYPAPFCPSLQTLARKRWHLVGTRLQFQITHQPHAAFPVQGFMYLFDNGKDVRQLTLDIRAGCMRFQNKVVALQQFYDAHYLLPDRDAFTRRLTCNSAVTFLVELLNTGS